MGVLFMKKRFGKLRKLMCGKKIFACLLVSMFFLCYSLANNIEATSTDKELDLNKKIRIGVLQYAEHEALDAAVNGFKTRILDLGFKEGENLEIVVKNAQGDISNAQTIAGQFANDNFDLYLAVATPAAQSLANKIKDRPILATAVTDYVAANLVDSNEHVNRNISGTSDVAPLEEQAELMKKIMSDKFNLAIVYCSSEINSELQAKKMKEIIESESIKVNLLTVSASNEIRQVVETGLQTADAIYIPTDNLLSSSMSLLNNIQKETKKAFFVGEKSQVLGGGLATIGIDYEDLGKQTAEMAKKILLENADIRTLSIESSKENKLYINKTTLDNLGIKVDDSLLKEAIIEEN